MQAPRIDAPRKRLYAGAAVLAALLAVLLFVLPAAGVTMPWDSNALQTVASDESSTTDAAETSGDGGDAAEAPADDLASADDAAASSDQAAAEGDAPAMVPSATDTGASDAAALSGAPSDAAPAPSSGGSSSGASAGSTSASGGGSTSAQTPSASGSSKQQAAPAASTITVTVTIDASNAHKANASYPSSMGSKQVTVKAGASVFDALKATGASIGGSSTYVSSINGLSEKACGSGSGWMYKVDGVYPNYACGKYKLQGGESIVWAYTVTKGDVS